jgi:hypothetical protein
MAETRRVWLSQQQDQHQQQEPGAGNPPKEKKVARKPEATGAAGGEAGAAAVAEAEVPQMRESDMNKRLPQYMADFDATWDGARGLRTSGTSIFSRMDNPYYRSLGHTQRLQRRRGQGNDDADDDRVGRENDDAVHLAHTPGPPGGRDDGAK